MAPRTHAAPRRRLRLLPFVLLLAGMAVATASFAEDVCHITDIDAFLEKCPTNDPALGRILSDFTITRDGVPVTFSASSCTEPISTLPVTQYNDAMSVLQLLRTIYYLDRDRCNYLPWTPLSLYDWLRSKVGGFNIDSTATVNQCCDTWPDGRLYMTLTTSDDTNLQYHKTWEGISVFIALLMHEARHVDGFAHVGCCPVGGVGCDPVYDESNLSPYGIQYWLEKSFLDGTIHTGYTCLSAARTSAIKSWLRGAANGGVDRFCSSPPPLLTDTNNPPPPCDSTCESTVTCIAPANGIPPAGGPPVWWSTSPPQPVYHDSLDDPRWAGASKITYGDGTGEKADVRLLHDLTYVYFSWRVFVAPASSADQNALYFGYRQPGGGDVIVKLSLTGTLSPLTADATHLSIESFLRNADQTQGAAVPVPAEISTSARVWVDPSSPGSWAVQFRLPKATFETTCDRFKLWYEVLAGTPTDPVTSFTWPRSGADIDGGTVADPHPLHYPDPVAWQWFRPSTGAGDRGCPVAGVSLSYTNIGTKNTPASNINFSASSPFPVNTFFARPTNNSGALIPANAITATFRLANWGSVPGDWESGVSVNDLWAAIPGGANVPLSGPIADLTTADDTSEAHFNWTVADPDLAAFISGERRSHQCMLVELKSAASPGLTFTNTSVYRNMDLVSASTFRRDALVSVKGLAPLSAKPRDIYIYVEARDLPARVRPKSPAALSSKTALAETGAVLAPPPPTYLVHVYHDTGKVITSGGKVRPILRYQTSFGYTVTHTGELEGWRHRIEGPGLVELAPGWYKIPVPNQGSATVTTTIEAIEPSPWSLSLHLGANRPLGQSRTSYSGGNGGGVDLEYRTGQAFAVELFLGRDRLPGKTGLADLAVTQLSVSGKAYFLSGTARPFVEAGIGAYELDPGSLKAGFHAGVGGQLAVTPRIALEVSVKEHAVGSSPRLRYATAQVGVRMRL
ncbi:MAG TPA: hypothetical protein VF713_18455 [Thermoanaerobaculia bacterium]